MMAMTSALVPGPVRPLRPRSGVEDLEQRRQRIARAVAQTTAGRHCRWRLQAPRPAPGARGSHRRGRLPPPECVSFGFAPWPSSSRTVSSAPGADGEQQRREPAVRTRLDVGAGLDRASARPRCGSRQRPTSTRSVRATVPWRSTSAPCARSSLTVSTLPGARGGHQRRLAFGQRRVRIGARLEQALDDRRRCRSDRRRRAAWRRSDWRSSRRRRPSTADRPSRRRRAGRPSAAAWCRRRWARWD